MNKKQKNLKSEKGITMISLILTLVILGILATISINYGMELVTTAENESVKTNMLLIKAKVKEYQEEVDFKSGIDEDAEKAEEARLEVYEETAMLEEIGELTDHLKNIGIVEENTNYYVTQETLKLMGLVQVKLRNDEKYIVSFDVDGNSEIYTTVGCVVEEEVDGEKVEKTIYSLSDLGE